MRHTEHTPCRRKGPAYRRALYGGGDSLAGLNGSVDGLDSVDRLGQAVFFLVIQFWAPPYLYQPRIDGCNLSEEYLYWRTNERSSDKADNPQRKKADHKIVEDITRRVFVKKKDKQKGSKKVSTLSTYKQ